MLDRPQLACEMVMLKTVKLEKDRIVACLEVLDRESVFSH